MKKIIVGILAITLCVGYGGDNREARAADNNEPQTNIQTVNEKAAKKKKKDLESQASKDLKKRGYTPGQMTGKDYKRIFGARD